MMLKVTMSLMCLACLIATGCEEEQLQQIDQAAQTGQQVVDVGGKVLQSPVGKFIPPLWTFWITLIGAVGNGFIAAWQKWRVEQKQKSLEEVVVGNESVKKLMDDKTSIVFKAAQNAAQSVATTKEVARIRNSIAA